jgi:hypothetical protein
MKNDDLWWGLPGPAHFVDCLWSDLRSGRNLVIGLPEHHPHGLRDALGSKLRESDLFDFRVLDLCDEEAEATQAPARYLHKRLSPLSDPGVSPSARTVALAPNLAGSVLWIDGITEKNWAVWRRFLDEYKDACRMCRDYERFLLVAPLVGLPATLWPKEELTLSLHRWEGIVRRIDMLIYTTAQIETGNVPAFLKDLATAVTVEVAGTDPLLVDLLASASIESIIEPLDIMREEADRRGWLARTCPVWHQGMIDRFNGRTLIHTAAEVAVGRPETVRRRVWRGQVAVLFPFLEDHRLRFVRMYRSLLEVPIRTDFEIINDAESLELTHLVYQLRRKIGPHKLQTVEYCLRIRNELAHLRPLRASDLVSPIIADLAEVE